MYEQNLVKIIEPIKKTTISRLNKGKKWKYGYNKEHDLIVISKTGQIGEIYEIQESNLSSLETQKEQFKNTYFNCLFNKITSWLRLSNSLTLSNSIEEFLFKSLLIEFNIFSFLTQTSKLCHARTSALPPVACAAARE